MGHKRGAGRNPKGMQCSQKRAQKPKADMDERQRVKAQDPTHTYTLYITSKRQNSRKEIDEDQNIANRKVKDNETLCVDKPEKCR